MTAAAVPLRYMGWMVRDLLLGPGLKMLVLAALTVWVAIAVTNGVVMVTSQVTVSGMASAVRPEGPVFDVHRIGVVLVLLATARIVSRDLSAGYYRLLFTKPVHPPAYYLLRWLLGGVVVVVTMLLVDGILAARLDGAMPGLMIVGRIGLFYLLVGGLVFFLSTLTRYDWIAAVLLLWGHRGIGVMRSAGIWSSRLWTIAYDALPPFHLVRLQDPIASRPELWHAGLYGLGLVLAGVAVLRWRPLGSGSRD